MSAFWLQKPSILRACVREEDTGGRDAGDLKMPLENGRADERVSRGQASERAVCVCEAVSVEMGAHRPPLPTAVVCPPGRRRRLRLARQSQKLIFLDSCNLLDRCTRLDDSSRMDAFARGPKRDPLMVPCITSLRQNRLVRMSIDKNAVRAR